MTELASGRGQPRPGRRYRNRRIRRPGRPLCSRVASVHLRVVVRCCFTCASRTRGADMEEERDPVPLVGRAGVAHFAQEKAELWPRVPRP